ncbi:MAG: oxygen-independent coproporphyrinogen III oxidase [Rhodobacteraceae bacterium HLUCCA12]|nr:MAG: oxygen-independent coproporphyrinogen III oxidase [Rhodobacteraceae bacterium HLUCCA12]
MADWEAGGFGVYVHWPFCQAKCPYCDFNSHVAGSVDHARWARAYSSELRRMRRLTGERVVSTVFFGGGTPSLMPPDLVAEVLNCIFSLWPRANQPEITLEANPTSADAGRFRGYFDAGVNRLSVGLQALDDGDLRRLGRLHSVSEGIAAYELARTIFPSTSLDLIYARQHQTLSQWRQELRAALDMKPTHLSLYQLTIEDGTAFGDRYKRGGLRGLPDDDHAADMYLATQDICDAAGLPAYEVSNHAEIGQESRHNLIYWRYGDYLGVGPGAHGRLTVNGQRQARQSVRMPGAWLDQVESSGTGELDPQALDSQDQKAEYLMMSLRLREGSNMARLCALGGAPDVNAVAELQESGHLWVDGDRIGVTQQGRIVLNSVLRRLL